MFNTISLAIDLSWEERFNNFIISLSIMWKGWLSIFIVLGIIAIIVFVMTKLQKPHKDDKEIQ